MAISVTIDGVDKTGILKEGGHLTIDDTLSGRSTCRFVIVDTTLAYDPPIGEEVFIYWNSTKIFGGTINSREFQVPTGTNAVRFIDVECVDFNQLCDRFTFAKIYENETIADIVTDIVDNETPLTSNEGVTIGFLETGPTVTKAVFNYSTVTKAFRDLADLGGMVWNIDADKVLNFHYRSKYAAPFDIGDGESLKYRNFRYSDNRKKYRNREILRAGYGITDQRVETFRGDYAPVSPEERRRTFNVAYPVNEITSIKREGVSQRVGIRGIDEDGDLTISGWKQWFYQVGSNEISQNSYEDETNNPTLTDSQDLEVTYYGQYPLVTITENQSEMDSRAAVEGGTGRYDYVDQDEQLDGRDLAFEKAERMLEQFGRIPASLEYETTEYGLKPGQLQTNAFSAVGFPSAEYLIDRVQARVMSMYSSILWWRISCMDGEREHGWRDWWQKLFDSTHKFTIRENEKIAVKKIFEDTINFTDSLDDSENGSATLATWRESPYIGTWLGYYMILATNEVVYGARIGATKMEVPYEIVSGFKARSYAIAYNVTTEVYGTVSVAAGIASASASGISAIGAPFNVVLGKAIANATAKNIT